MQDYVTAAGGAEKLLHFGSKNTREMSFHLAFQDGLHQYRLSLSPTADDGIFPSSENAYPAPYPDPYPAPSPPPYPEPYGTVLSSREKGREAGISDPKSESAAVWVRNRVGGWRPYHLHDTSSSSPMRKTNKVDDNRFLRPDGSNLASFLFQLRESNADSYSLIRRTIQRVAPFFEDFELQPLLRRPDDIKLEWSHKGSDQYFDASSLSDGTLRFIVLTTLFLQPIQYRPSVILVDEPELGLHPYAIEILASLIRQASVDTQVIVSTQSSLLLDHFDPDDVLVANRIEGGTGITRLDSRALAAWQEDYSLGQLWEKNEFGGRPGKG